MSSLRGVSILLTGATGFLGTAIRQELERLGARTISVVWPSLDEHGQQTDVIALDLSKPIGWEQLDTVRTVDSIIHCAAILPGVLSDGELLNTNQQMTYHLLEWAVKEKISHFIFASTCRVYGLQSHPCLETFPLFPPDLYTVSKISCEYMVKVMMNARSIPSCILRISAPYGPHSKADTVIRRFLMNSAQGLPITLYGSGNRSQDFVYERDVARAFGMALFHRATGTFNVAGGRSIAIKDLAKMALDMFERDHQEYMTFSGIDAQENYRGNFPTEKAHDAFGYYPQTSIYDGLKLTGRAWGLL